MGNGAEKGLGYIEPQRVKYSEETRRRLELTQQISFLSATLPPLPLPKEGYNLTPISFDQQQREEGIAVLLDLNDFMHTEVHGEREEERKVYFVQPRTVQILDALSFPYINHSTIQPSQG